MGKFAIQTLLRVDVYGANHTAVINSDGSLDITSDGNIIEHHYEISTWTILAPKALQKRLSSQRPEK